MNHDGLMDILFTNGDAFDYLPPRPRPWHSVQWLENKGNHTFEHHPIGKFEGGRRRQRWGHGCGRGELL
jgi:hypothetical protein